MGFFDTLKQGAKNLANRVTGGYGKIEFLMDSHEASPGDRVPVQIKVDATGDLKANRVMLRLRGTENINVEIREQNEDGSTSGGRHNVSTCTQEEEYQISGAIEMKEGDSKTFSGEIIIPQNCQPTYQGISAIHTWTIEADVDVPMGKDLKQSYEIRIR